MIAVDLTVYFEPVQGLQVSHFSALREAWRDEYPDTAELPPLRPANRGGDETSVARIDQAWPFPYLMFGTKDDSGSVAFQSDRLTRSWRFTEGSRYPGFLQLAADLESRIKDFSDAVKVETGQDVTLTTSECGYQNRLSNSVAPDALVGLLTGWQVSDLTPAARRARYSGIRLHLCNDDELSDCVMWVSLDVDEDGVILALNSESTNSHSGARLGGLDAAHGALIDTFIQFTSSEMHDSWGMVR